MNATTLRPHRGDLVLNLSILSLYFFPLGALAWILGGRELARIDAGLVDPEGRGSIQCARWIGAATAAINFVLFVAFAFAVLLIVLGLRAWL